MWYLVVNYDKDHTLWPKVRVLRTPQLSLRTALVPQLSDASFGLRLKILIPSCGSGLK